MSGGKHVDDLTQLEMWRLHLLLEQAVPIPGHVTQLTTRRTEGPRVALLCILLADRSARSGDGYAGGGRSWGVSQENQRPTRLYATDVAA